MASSRITEKPEHRDIWRIEDNTGKLYLQLYMKLKAANQDHYYFCKVNLGPCSRKYLVTGHLIRFEVTLQDLRFEFEVEQSKPCKNLRI